MSTTMSNKYLATINTPGYSPQDDDPPTFDTAREAWRYLADERIRDEDTALEVGDAAEPAGYSATVNILEGIADGRLSTEEFGLDWDGTGSVSGPSTEEKMYDLGLSYNVTVVEPCDHGEHVVEVDGEECTVCGQGTPMPETFTINERVLTDDTVTWAPDGFKLEGGYAGIVTYHTFQSPNSDNENVTGFRTVEETEAFIVGRYGKTSDELISDMADAEGE